MSKLDDNPDSARVSATNIHTRFTQRFVGLWERLTGSLWFLPGAVVLAFFGAGVGFIDLSILFDKAAAEHMPRLIGATPASARSVLSAIAASVITVAGVTFSVMVVAVSQASSQYTPRVLRNFMRDRLSQITLGVLVGVFVYALVVLRTIREASEGGFVPEIAVSAALLFAFIAVAMLMYFIHHIASTLEAGSIIARISEETVSTIDKLFPEQLGEEKDGDHHEEHETQSRSWLPILSDHTGYIQRVDTEGLLQLATGNKCVLRMERMIGDFVAVGQVLAWTSYRKSENLDSQLCDLYHFASYRTVHQDAAFGVRQIVDIALKALSPSVNDTTTAVTCVRYLTAILLEAVARRIPSPLRFFEGELRVIARGPTFSDLLAEAFDEIRFNASNNPRVLLVLARSLEALVRATCSTHRRADIFRHITRVSTAMQTNPKLQGECEMGLAVCARVLNEGAK
jgi:uncharacterized membrane protein